MKDQHEKIAGYRDLSQAEIDAINKIKQIAQQCGDLIQELDSIALIDKRSLALGKTNLQQGFMWTIRAIARPTTFG